MISFFYLLFQISFASSSLLQCSSSLTHFSTSLTKCCTSSSQFPDAFVCEYSFSLLNALDKYSHIIKEQRKDTLIKRKVHFDFLLHDDECICKLCSPSYKPQRPCLVMKDKRSFGIIFLSDIKPTWRTVHEPRGKSVAKKIDIQTDDEDSLTGRLDSLDASEDSSSDEEESEESLFICAYSYNGLTRFISKFSAEKIEFYTRLHTTQNTITLLENDDNECSSCCIS